MPELNPNNLENQRPLSQEELEVLKKLQERAEARKNAGEMLDELEQRNTREPGVPFDSGRPSDELAEKTAEALKINPRETKQSSDNISDKAQEFIDRLANSKSQPEAVAIMNEVLAAASSGKIPPSEANEILSRSSNP